MDTDNNKQDDQEQSKATQREQDRLEREQANLISIPLAQQHTTQDELAKAHTFEKMYNQKTDDTNNTTKNNINDSQEPTGITQEETITEDANTKNTKDNELQLIKRLQTKTQNSITSSTTSHECCTPPPSPNSAMSDINTADLEELNETL